ncbi:MAG TPA: hypothetical protein DCQ14_05090 [Firmicutes bacterium]|nr:hypothetical protein [Bacillota bacterium]
MNIIKELIIKVTKFCDFPARFILLLIMLLVVGNIVLRLLGKPLDGSHEWVGLLTGISISLSLAYCAIREGHVSITILFERLGGRTRQYAELLVNLFSLSLLIVLLRTIILYGNRMLAGGHVGVNTGVPLHYFAYIIACGFLVYSLAVIYHIAENVEKMIKR